MWDFCQWSHSKVKYPSSFLFCLLSLTPSSSLSFSFFSTSPYRESTLTLGAAGEISPKHFAYQPGLRPGQQEGSSLGSPCFSWVGGPAGPWWMDTVGAVGWFWTGPGWGGLRRCGSRISAASDETWSGSVMGIKNCKSQVAWDTEWAPDEVEKNKFFIKSSLTQKR